MILGTYWYFGFPTDLYRFDYFEFRKGLGGHFGNQAELLTTFETEHSVEIINSLKGLIEKYSEGFLFIYVENNKLQIGTGGHQLYDYDFLIIEEVEKILKEYDVVLTKNEIFNDPTIIKFYNEDLQIKMTYPKKKFLQIVGSELKIHNAENSKLRVDCNLHLTNKDKFINELKDLVNEENIDVFFYMYNDFKEQTNLMLFFTNGRQGLKLKTKKSIDILNFESKIENIVKKNNASFGHIGGLDLYPLNGPKIEKMIEQDFIL